MNEDIQRFDRIQDYLDGNMSPEERQAFEAQMAADATLAEEVGVHRLEREMMDIMLEDDLSEQLQSWQQEKQQMPIEQPKRFNWRPWAIGLIVFLGILLLVLYLMRSRPENTAPSSKGPDQTDQSTEEERTLPSAPQKGAGEKKKYDGPVADSGKEPAGNNQSQNAGMIALAEEFGGTPEFVGTFVRSGEEAKSRFDSASLLIREKRYDEAIGLLQKIPGDNQEAFLNARLHLGYLYFLKKDFRGSIPYLESAAANQDYLYAETAEWYLLLAYLASGPGQRNKFEQKLSGMLADEEHSYYQKAIQLKGRVE